MPLSNTTTNSATDLGTPDTLDFIESSYPFAQWSTVEDRNLHPVLSLLWHQVRTRYWYFGHPAANDLLFAVYEMSRCASFRQEVSPCTG